jgi:hypothetical protein
LFIEEPIETNHSGNMFIKELIKSHNEGITINELVENKTSCDLSKQELLKKVSITY